MLTPSGGHHLRLVGLVAMATCRLTHLEPDGSVVVRNVKDLLVFLADPMTWSDLGVVVGRRAAPAAADPTLLPCVRRARGGSLSRINIQRKPETRTSGIDQQILNWTLSHNNLQQTNTRGSEFRTQKEQKSCSGSVSAGPPEPKSAL